jgi:outer membrane lipopolysaccharide assembly protein LptE/RlpB
MRKLIILLAAIVLLSGCGHIKPDGQFEPDMGSNKITGTFKDVTILKLENRLKPFRYAVTVANGSQKVTLIAKSQESFDILHEGDIIDISYNEKYYIQTIQFKDMEEK